MAVYTSAPDPPVVLLNGFWHGTWCWSRVLPHFAAMGRTAIPVDLAGHGLYARRPRWLSSPGYDLEAIETEPCPLPDISLDDAAALLITQIKQIGAGSPVAVVAHSAAGLVLTRAAQQAPELFDHAIYLCAFMPATDVLPNAYNELPESDAAALAALYRGDPTVTHALRIDLATDDPCYRAGLCDAFYADVDPTLAEAAIGLLTPDVPVSMTLGATTLTPQGWGSVRHSYICTSKGRGLTAAVQDRFIAEADATFPDNLTRVAKLDSGHSPFLSMPGELVETIIDLDQRT